MTLFLGSGPFGLPALRRLARLRPDLAVCTVPDAPRGRSGKAVPTVVKKAALELGLECHEVSTLKEDAGPDLLSRTGAELVITADFRLILPRSFLDAPSRGCFNLHGSLLPRYRGAAPVVRGVLAGDRIYGITLYRMVRAVDAGPVVACSEYQPPAKQDAPTIEGVLAEHAADLIEEWLPRLESGDVPLVPQDESLATLAPKLTKSEGWLDWTRAPDRLEDQVLALVAWPRTFTRWQGHDGTARGLLFIDRVRVVETLAEPIPPGTVRTTAGSAIGVACGPEGRHTLEVLALQREGRRRLSAEEFLRGGALRTGDLFGGDEEAT